MPQRNLCVLLLLLTLFLPPNGRHDGQDFQKTDHPNLLSLDTFDTSPDFVPAFERSREPVERIAADYPLVAVESRPAIDQILFRPHWRLQANIPGNVLFFQTPFLPRPPPFSA